MMAMHHFESANKEYQEWAEKQRYIESMQNSAYNKLGAALAVPQAVPQEKDPSIVLLLEDV